MQSRLGHMSLFRDDRHELVQRSDLGARENVRPSRRGRQGSAQTGSSM
jgi:hypothetical protein